MQNKNTLKGLLAVSAVAYGRHAPIQGAIEMYSPFLCGRFALQP